MGTNGNAGCGRVECVCGEMHVETLTHFRCAVCGCWWSIGDAPLDRQMWYCPWCGSYHRMEPYVPNYADAGEEAADEEV